MKKLLLLPVALYPYLFILWLAIMNFLASTEQTPLALVISFIFLALPTVCNIIYMVLSRKEDAHKLLGQALLVKVIHIPSYVLIYLFGLGASLMIFMTFPLIIFLVLFDFLILLSSSMISIFALAKNARNMPALSIIALVLQHTFCADIISLFIVRRISKKRKKALEEQA